jgi:hypothetical protein
MAADNNNGAFISTGGIASCVSTSCYDGWFSFSNPHYASQTTLNNTVASFFTPYMQKPSDPPDATRGIGGYLYGNSNGGTGDDGAFASGMYLNWTLEPGGSCAPGRQYAHTSSYTQCLLKIN